MYEFSSSEMIRHGCKVQVYAQRCEQLCLFLGIYLQQLRSPSAVKHLRGRKRLITESGVFAHSHHRAALLVNCNERGNSHGRAYFRRKGSHRFGACVLEIIGVHGISAEIVFRYDLRRIGRHSCQQQLTYLFIGGHFRKQLICPFGIFLRLGLLRNGGLRLSHLSLGYLGKGYAHGRGVLADVCVIFNYIVHRFADGRAPCKCGSAENGKKL